ncbi:MAG TPA: pyridoxamine 5'-phosphate oxidase family protein, partial [Candidatus Binataceae bacterium]|nr:pyridoxamine 5'-phosphate oxidase family protein [Candidatus Binataceae bacterium]
MKYHDGEIAVQARAGVRRQAEKLAAGIRGSISPDRHEFVAAQRMAVLGTVDRRGRVWASVVTGEAGFLQALDERTIRIAAVPAAGDPLLENLALPAHAALIVPDLAARRRLRLNGRGQIAAGAIEIQAEQVYGNCSHYIQARAPIGEHRWRGGAGTAAVRTADLSAEQQGLIARADTFFIATDHPESGADISHRGGNPGCVRIVDSHRLAIPDYSGNNMFNTLGNIVANPRVGLLFVGFESGRTLQLTGRAAIDWDSNRAATLAGAARVVDFELGEAVDNPQGFALSYEFHEYSHFNPS